MPLRRSVRIQEEVVLGELVVEQISEWHTQTLVAGDVIKPQGLEKTLHEIGRCSSGLNRFCPTATCYADPSRSPSQAICRVREIIRRQHKALATEDCYTFWLRRYMTPLLKMPADLSSEKKLERFLTDLARHRDVSASSPNQALNAILFFYREVLGQSIGNVNALRAESGPHFSPVCVAFMVAWKNCSGLCAPENAGCPFVTKSGTLFTPTILAASVSPTPPPANSPTEFALSQTDS